MRMNGYNTSFGRIDPSKSTAKCRLSDPSSSVNEDLGLLTLERKIDILHQHASRAHCTQA
jgi:hypothetical protein